MKNKHSKDIQISIWLYPEMLKNGE